MLSCERQRFQSDGDWFGVDQTRLTVYKKPSAARGKDLERAARIAVVDANAAGGVNGHRIELTVYDDGDLSLENCPDARASGARSSPAAGEVYKPQPIPTITAQRHL
jgi:hypothetical protein